jgi:magnesium transporter
MEENEELLSSVNKDFTEELVEIIQSKQSMKKIREDLEHYHENDIAEALERLTKEERLKLYKILGDEKVSEIFAYLDDVEEYISELSSEKAADIIEEMDVDDAIDVLEELEEDKKQELLDLIDEEAKADIDMVSSYSDEQIGSKMTTNYIAINKDCSIKQAMKSLISQAADNDNVSTIYAINDDGTYFGAMELRDLIVARATLELKDIISTSYPYVYAEEETEKCFDEIRDYEEDSIPVLNSQNELIGVITSSDIVEVIDEQAEEDLANFAGITEMEDLNEPLHKSIRKRTPWLLVLLALGMFISSITGMFENSVIVVLPFIVAFQSLVMGLSGNTGTQSLAITLRVLDNEDIHFKEKMKYVFKEMRVGFANGLILGLICFIFMGLYLFWINGRTLFISFATSGCISIALLISIIISATMGCLIPMFFKKIKIDPAVASGPLITTINDLIAVVTYYGFAWLFLIKMLAI